MRYDNADIQKIQPTHLLIKPSVFSFVRKEIIQQILVNKM